MEISDFSCADCGAPATHGVRDMHEAAPPEGCTIEHWTAEDPPRWGCDTHPQQSRTIYLDGTIITTTTGDPNE